MRYDVAPCRLLIWLAAAVIGWAVVIGTCLYVPQAYAGLAVAAVVLWRWSKRPVDPTLPSVARTADVRAGDGRTRSADDVRRLVATSV